MWSKGMLPWECLDFRSSDIARKMFISTYSQKTLAVFAEKQHYCGYDITSNYGQEGSDTKPVPKFLSPQFEKCIFKTIFQSQSSVASLTHFRPSLALITHHLIIS